MPNVDRMIMNIEKVKKLRDLLAEVKYVISRTINLLHSSKRNFHSTEIKNARELLEKVLGEIEEGLK